jgi:hypothetical protein
VLTYVAVDPAPNLNTEFIEMTCNTDDSIEVIVKDQISQITSLFGGDPLKVAILSLRDAKRGPTANRGEASSKNETKDRQ